MKKLFSILSIAVLAAACAKEPVPTPDPTPVVEKVHVEFSANLEDTKATIGQMKWEEDDKITIWVKSALGTPGYNGDEVSIVDPQTGKFEGDIASPNPEGDTFYAAYNASSIQAVEGTYVPVFNIPAVQNTAAAGATKAMLKGEFTGVKENIRFTMTAATAKLKINVTEVVSKVVFAGMNDETIASASKTLTYEGSAVTAVEFIVPAMTFTNGYKVTYTNESGTMYQSYSGSKSFVAGTERTINCTFVPFGIGVGFKKEPMSSYSYYLKGDAESIATANSANFETTGENGSGGTGPDIYDDDAKGFYTGIVEGGTAKIIVSGASTAVLPDMKMTEWGYYVTCNQRIDVNSDESYLEMKEIKVVIAKNQNVKLNKTLEWTVCGEADPQTPAQGHDFTKRELSGEDSTPAGYAKFYAGDVKLNPYVIVGGVEYCMIDRGTEGKVGQSLCITGLPHRSNHKDLWYVAKQRTRQQAIDGIVSGEVRRINDDSGYPVDMFYSRYYDGNWDDFCVKSRGFNIPEGKTIEARPVMYGVLWGGNHILFASPMNAYFYYDAEKDLDEHGEVSYTLHNTPTPSGSKIVPSGYDAKIELADATKSAAYGYTTTTSSVTLSPEFAHMNIYMWIYRGDLRPAVGDNNTPGYWCRYIQVQYAAPSGN